MLNSLISSQPTHIKTQNTQITPPLNPPPRPSNAPWGFTRLSLAPIEAVRTSKKRTLQPWNSGRIHGRAAWVTTPVRWFIPPSCCRASPPIPRNVVVGQRSCKRCMELRMRGEGGHTSDLLVLGGWLVRPPFPSPPQRCPREARFATTPRQYRLENIAMRPPLSRVGSFARPPAAEKDGGCNPSQSMHVPQPRHDCLHLHCHSHRHCCHRQTAVVSATHDMPTPATGHNERRRTPPDSLHEVSHINSVPLGPGARRVV